MHLQKFLCDNKNLWTTYGKVLNWGAFFDSWVLASFVPYNSVLTYIQPKTSHLDPDERKVHYERMRAYTGAITKFTSGAWQSGMLYLR